MSKQTQNTVQERPKGPGIFNFILLGLSAVVLVVYTFFIDGIENIIGAYNLARKEWLLLALGAMVMYWLLAAGILHIPLRKLSRKCTFKDTFRVSMAGQYFNCVTPFATGGEPMQAYLLTKNGVPLGAATGALLIKFIVYQIVLTVYSVVVLLLKYTELTAASPLIGYVVLMGFLLNAAVAVGLLCVGFFKGFTQRAAHGIIRLLGRFRIVKNVEERQKSVDKQLEEFHQGFTIIRRNLPVVALMVVGTIIQLTFFFAIPFCIYRAFSLIGASSVTMLAACATVFMVSSLLPIPGGPELGFATLFGMFFPATLITFAVLLWRLLTFYMPIAVGSFFAGGKRRVKNGVKALGTRRPVINNGG